MKVVPSPRSAQAGVIGVVGSFKSGLSLAIAGSFHWVTCQVKSANQRAKEFERCVMPGKLYVGTRPPAHVGNLDDCWPLRRRFQFLFVIGESDAEK